MPATIAPDGLDTLDRERRERNHRRRLPPFFVFDCAFAIRLHVAISDINLLNSDVKRFVYYYAPSCVSTVHAIASSDEQASCAIW